MENQEMVIENSVTNILSSPLDPDLYAHTFFFFFFFFFFLLKQLYLF